MSLMEEELKPAAILVLMSLQIYLENVNNQI